MINFIFFFQKVDGLILSNNEKRKMTIVIFKIKEVSMEEKIKELTLLLLYLTSWEEEYSDRKIKRCWKTFRFEVLDELREEGIITGKRKSKSVYLTDKGENLAKEIKEKYL